MSQKSLFSYFKSPSTSKSESEKTTAKDSPNDRASRNEDDKENGGDISETPTRKPAKKRERKTQVEKNPKRRRVIIADEESDTGNASSSDEYEPSEGESSSSSLEDFMEEEDGKRSPDIKKKKTSKPSTKGISPSVSRDTSFSDTSSPSVGKKTLGKLSSFTALPETPNNEMDGSRFHLSLDFLKPGNIRDKEKRSPHDEGYDCRTVYIPQKFKDTVTPAMRQWWDLKEDHFDTVLFFKMGKFYELFHMDADVGVKELGLVYMKGNYAHAGFPEIAYGRYADVLLRKGYKVARIEQTETPEMMNERVADSGKKSKFDKVVNREICQIATSGTRTSNFMDGENIDSTSSYLLAVCDKSAEKGFLVGVCFVDTSTGNIHIGQFEDDDHGSRLRTLIAHHQPGQVLYEKKKLSVLLESLFKTTLASVSKEGLVVDREFWPSAKTIKVLSEGDYFRNEQSSELAWPELLEKILCQGSTVACEAPVQYDLALRSLGAVVWYLSYCFMDHEILSMKSFQEYVPLDRLQSTRDESERPRGLDGARMVLDSVTLTNLDIIVNQSTGTAEGTLLERLDFCKTAGGRRLLREWICAPLCGRKAIQDRLEAVSNLISLRSFTTSHIDMMRKLPDFERLLARIHLLGDSKRSTTHPDSRAIFFEHETYSKRKIDSFLCLLAGFSKAQEIIKEFSKHLADISSRILKKCVTLKSEWGLFPDIQDTLNYFNDAFDHEAARKAGAIHPAKGFVDEYDESVDSINRIEAQLDKYLQEQKKLLSCSQVNYIGSGRNRFQLELPDSAAKRVPGHYEVTGQRKGYRRYTTEVLKEFLSELMEAEDKRTAALKDTMRRIFSKFDERFSMWMDAVRCINVLDVLVSLATYSSTCDGDMCKPEIASDIDQPVIEIRNGRHPSAIKIFGQGDFIPNDTVIGTTADSEGEFPNTAALTVLLTGPNMGGKSTLMRQVGLIAIMAQLGCYVPASKCRLSPIDRLFTRLGASDRIMHGESTFFVELSETATILQHATRNSLVLLDELGRGTSTHDGTAIASAVVNHLASTIRCRMIFSTHYHSLVDDFLSSPDVQLGHMACLVDKDEESGEETVTFLYKFAPHVCPKSYGFNVARLAGLPDKVIKLGLKKTEELETTLKCHMTLRSILSASEMDCVSLIRRIE